jgi:retron-type reverse transcriptase
MKRQNNLFEKIIDYNNIRSAFLKTIKGIRKSSSVINFCKNTYKNLMSIRENIINLNCGWGNYKTFYIFDPKKRAINTAPIEQRIMHHAICNVLEPVFERSMIFHSYACRKGKGSHSTLKYAFRQCKTKKYFLKLDVRKYFDSIDHYVLKIQLRRLIKDTRVLILLDGIIDSYETEPGKGVPIGNLTSQYFANFYLAVMDHFILEKLNPNGYCRYMDDFVLWANSQAELALMFKEIVNFTKEKLFLTLKQPVFGKTSSGLPFLGFLVKNIGIYLLQKSKNRVKNRLSEITYLFNNLLITEEKAGERAICVFAAITLARTHQFRLKLLYREAVACFKKHEGSNRIIRGGSWNNNASNLESSIRNNNNPDNRNNNLGFRLVSP